MGLMQRQRQTYSSTQPLYKLSGESSYLVVGLGNSGKKYLKTRHNVGFMCLDDYAQRNELPPFKHKKDLMCEITEQINGNKKIYLIKPTTLMNNSGRAVRAVQEYYDLYNEQTLAIYDELAIPFGQLRTRVGGDSAGHNGVKSLIEHIGDDFGRLRIGIGSPAATKADPADYVLKNFPAEEAKNLPLIIKEAGVITSEFVFSGQLHHDTRSAI